LRKRVKLNKTKQQSTTYNKGYTYMYYFNTSYGFELSIENVEETNQHKMDTTHCMNNMCLFKLNKKQERSYIQCVSVIDSKKFFITHIVDIHVIFL